MNLANEFPKVVFDQTAETFAELRAQWPMGVDALKQFIRKKLASGEWERVLKRLDKRTYPAYRRTVKRKN